MGDAWKAISESAELRELLAAASSLLDAVAVEASSTAESRP